MTRQINTEDGVWFYAYKQPSWKAIMDLHNASKKEGLEIDEKTKQPIIPPSDILRIFCPFFRIGRSENEMGQATVEWWEDANFELVNTVLKDFMEEFKGMTKDTNPTLTPSVSEKTTT